MLRSITAKQLQGWEAYARLEPFSEVRADYRTASIVQMIANVNRETKRKAYTLQDFLLRFDEHEPVKKQTQQDQFNMLKILAMVQSKSKDA